MSKMIPLFSWNQELEKRYSALRDQDKRWDKSQQQELKGLLGLRDMWLSDELKKNKEEKQQCLPFK